MEKTTVEQHIENLKRDLKDNIDNGKIKTTADMKNFYTLDEGIMLMDEAIDLLEVQYLPRNSDYSRHQ